MTPGSRKNRDLISTLSKITGLIKIQNSSSLSHFFQKSRQCCLKMFKTPNFLVPKSETFINGVVWVRRKQEEGVSREISRFAWGNERTDMGPIVTPLMVGCACVGREELGRSCITPLLCFWVSPPPLPHSPLANTERRRSCVHSTRIVCAYTQRRWRWDRERERERGRRWRTMRVSRGRRLSEITMLPSQSSHRPAGGNPPYRFHIVY